MKKNRHKVDGRSFGGPGCPPPTRLAPWGRGCPDHRTCPPFPQMAPRFQTKRKDRRQNALSGGNTHYVSTITPQIADSWYSCAGMLVGCLVFGNTHLLNFFITKKINTLSICAFLHTLAHRRDAHKLRGFHYPLCHMRSIAHMNGHNHCVLCTAVWGHGEKTLGLPSTTPNCSTWVVPQAPLFPLQAPRNHNSMPHRFSRFFTTCVLSPPPNDSARSP